ncbi:MAG: DUF192 domain-containing protein [Firmicutes bacterium]|nr:DUF192 domain-containing protein [Bacillota bacterium]
MGGVGLGEKGRRRPSGTDLRLFLRTADSQRLVAGNVVVAGTALRRALGLLGRRSMTPGEALVLVPCNSVHTWFMMFPIDVVFLDRAGRILKLYDEIRPFRFALSLAAFAAVELPARSASRAGLRPGAELFLA